MDAILFWFGVFALGLAVAWLAGWLLFSLAQSGPMSQVIPKAAL